MTIQAHVDRIRELLYPRFPIAEPDYDGPKFRVLVEAREEDDAVAVKFFVDMDHLRFLRHSWRAYEATETLLTDAGYTCVGPPVRFGLGLFRPTT